MQNFIEIIRFVSPIFYRMLNMSIKATIIGGIIFILLKLLKKKICPKDKYSIWLIFILLLLIPIQFKTNLDVKSLKENNTEIYALADIEENYFAIYNNKILENNFNYQNYKTDININFTIKNIIPVIWISIVLVNSIIYIISFEKHNKKVREFICKDSRILEILKNCKQKLKINRKISIFCDDSILSPSTTGIGKVKILLPKEILDLSDKEIEYIILHELSHYKRGDNLLNIILSVLIIIYFYNPLIKFLINEFKKEMECAVDETANNCLTHEESLEYCRTLVNYSYNKVEDKFSMTLAWNDNKTTLGNRIDMIKLSFNGYNKFQKILVFFIIIFLCFTVFIFSIDGRRLSLSQTEDLLNANINKINEISFEKNKNYFNGDNKQSTEYIECNYNLSDIFLLTLQHIDNENLFYKYLGEKDYNGKRCYVFSTYCKTNKDFGEEQFWVDLDTGNVLKVEEYYNSESNLKPSNPITVIEYSY